VVKQAKVYRLTFWSPLVEDTSRQSNLLLISMPLAIYVDLIFGEGKPQVDAQKVCIVSVVVVLDGM
jgi:hypothetical protein